MRSLIVAAGARDAAERFSASLPQPTPVMGRGDIAAAGGIRRVVAEEQIDRLIVHTPDWAWQRNPQLYEVMLALAPVRARFLVDDAAGGTPRRIARPRALVQTATFPLSAAGGAAAAGLEATRFSIRRRLQGDRRRPMQPEAVLAVWIGEPGTTVGGSVTHISGILGGLRKAGLRVGLVTFGSPPEQLAAVIDDLELAAPVPARGRITSDVECILMNREVRRAGRLLSNRLGPAFVYQRHRAFLVAGVDVARAAGSPFVLEWNSSEVWTRANWEGFHALERIFHPHLVRAERYVTERADCVVAVSEHAAEAALEIGAPEGRVSVIPNGVDVEEVDRVLGQAPAAPQGRRLGWIGSFGPWHGAEMIVRALALLPPDVELLMVGDGSARPACQALADRLGLGARVTWAGSVAHADALRLLGGCDLLVSPHVPLPGRSFFGSPTKIFEYMAIGRPIVASALGQLADVLEDGVTARLVPPGDPDALAAGIREVMESPDRGAALGRRAHEEARRGHSWDSRAHDLLARLGVPAG
jgi:glycosyltransferase involved in cell wall biosynthesis